MEIKQIHENKKEYLTLLLLADEQETMIDRYLEAGDLFALDDGGVKGVCVVLHLGGTEYEIKNIAVDPHHQGKGYGRKMIEFICARYRGRCTALFVGTGDGTRTVQFYQRCGFAPSHRIKDFFTDNYDHPMVEDGVLLRDMVVLKRVLA